MSQGSRIYLALYFNVERTEDLDLLTLLYALPLTRRGPAIKQILRRTPRGLPGRASPGSLPARSPDRAGSRRRASPVRTSASPGRASGRRQARSALSSSGVDPRGPCPEDNRPGSGGAHGRRGPGPVRQRRDPPRPPAPVVPAMRVSATERTRSSVRRDARTASRPWEGSANARCGPDGSGEGIPRIGAEFHGRLRAAPPGGAPHEIPVLAWRHRMTVRPW